MNHFQPWPKDPNKAETKKNNYKSKGLVYY